ncbi:MAG: aspartate-semialdehyde dehydrogenase [Candidatus Cloacimonetes bacterium]|nr:aspartate-semialdehyde dehydrogenase [Candidatus Cloacimonadota bacterium]
MKLAIIGATGEVGRMVLTCLEEFEVKFDVLDLYASFKSKGTIIKSKNNSYRINGFDNDSFKKNYDYVFFTAGGAISKDFAQDAVDSGATVIDNSSAFRQIDFIPLVVPEVNGDILKSYKGIIANPNCSTIQLVLVLKPLNDYKKIKKVVVTTMQSVSGTGRTGIIELQNQRNGLSDAKVYPKQIDLNIIPQIGEFNSTETESSLHNTSLNIGRYCHEETKMTLETKKILNITNFNLVATTVRVPVIYGHSESVYIEFEEKVRLEEIKYALSQSNAVLYEENYITPLEVGDSNLSHVSRLRYAGDDKSILFWNVANNVRVGAATNAVKILQKHRIFNASLF